MKFSLLCGSKKKATPEAIRADIVKLKMKIAKSKYRPEAIPGNVLQLDAKYHVKDLLTPLNDLSDYLQHKATHCQYLASAERRTARI